MRRYQWLVPRLAVFTGIAWLLEQKVGPLWAWAVPAGMVVVGVGAALVTRVFSSNRHRQKSPR